MLMVSWRRRAAYAMVVLASVLAVTACGASGPAKSPVAKLLPINIGWQPDPNAALYVAREEGLFQKNGLSPTFTVFESAPPMFSALKADAVDVSDVGAVPYAIGLSQGIGLRALMVNVDVSNTNSLVVRSGVTSFAQLRGATVATTTGSGTYLLLLELLRQAHMTMSDIHYVNMTVGDMIPAWEHGDISAGLAWSPWIYELPGGHVLTSMKAAGIYVPQFWTATTSFVADHPQAALRFVRTMTEALTLIHKNPSLAIKAMAAQLSVSTSLAGKLLRNNSYPLAAEQLSPSYVLSLGPGAKGGGAAAAEQRVADLLFKDGFLKHAISVKSSMDPRFLIQAVKG